jgi:hypothetical protein
MASSSAQLFIPYCTTPQGPWVVRRASAPLARYASQALAIAAAEDLAPAMSDSLGLPVEIHVQQADGTWEEHTFVVAGLVAGQPTPPADIARHG